MKKLISVLALAATVLLGTYNPANALIDVVEAPTGYFTPNSAATYDYPYYRWAGEDWGWTHNVIGGTFSTATLSISAFDVDWAGQPQYGYAGELDNIYAYDNGVKTLIGSLSGENDQWSYTTFTLGSNFFDDIAAGLEVFMEIDARDEGWAVALAKSVLTLDGGTLPNPNPGTTPVPEPSTILLLGAGLAGLGFARKRFAKN